VLVEVLAVVVVVSSSLRGKGTIRWMVVLELISGDATAGGGDGGDGGDEGGTSSAASSAVSSAASSAASSGGDSGDDNDEGDATPIESVSEETGTPI